MERQKHNWSDEEILYALQEPRTASEGIRYLYRAYFDSLSAYVTTNSGTFDDAQDLFQEVLIAFVHLVQEGKFRGESSLKTFLYSMNRNLWLNELKKRRRAEKREKAWEADTVLEHDAAIDQVIDKRESLDKLMKMVESLGADCKKILLLFYFENKAMKEILAETAFENEQVVRNKKYKCLKKLEERISADAQVHHQLKTFFHG